MKHLPSVSCFTSLGTLWVTVVLLHCYLFTSCNAAVNYLTEYDRLRLQQVLTSSWGSSDLPTIHYSVLGSKLLAQNIPHSQEICKFLLESSKTQTSLESYYYLTLTWKSLGNCPGAFPTAAVTKAFNDAMSKDTSTILDLYYAVLGTKSLGQTLSNNAKLVKTVQAALKKDDSIANIGYTLHIASQMGPDGVFAFDRIEDALVQADEVDGRFLQFEGGLSITALVISGTFNLAEAVKKAPPITPQQTVKFANYFVSRRSVQTVKGVHSLANVVTILSHNNFQTHVSLGVSGSGAVSVSQPKVSVLVCDLLGYPITVPIAVTLEQATRLSDGVAVINNKEFTQASNNKMIYTVPLVEPTGELPGIYRLTVSVTASASAKLIGNIAVPLDVKVLAHAVFPEPLLIGSADSDQITQPKYHKVTYPNKLNQILEVDILQKLAMRFSLKEKVTGKPLRVHQAFVRLVHQKSGQEVIFVAEKDVGVMYKLDLDIGSKSNELNHLSGMYTVDLIIGDMILANSFSWKLADVKLNLGTSDQKASGQSIFKPKPEIKHLFREPEIRPPILVSNLFTGLVFLPLLILIVLWLNLGINLSNFSFSLSTFGFHLGLGGIFCLFGLFWLKMNMFETLKYLLALGLVTFLSGNQLLSKIANHQKA